MENEELVKAVHKLEVNVLERIGTQTTAIEVTNERLENLRIAVDRHREILFGHDDGEKPGLLQDMNELKRTEKERKLTLRGVTAAFVGLVGKFLWDLWHV
jgi:hypothetical protein